MKLFATRRRVEFLNLNLKGHCRNVRIFMSRHRDAAGLVEIGRADIAGVHK
jgi:hypothetical protein